MLSYYIQHGYEISMNAQQFYFMLRNSFSERDGYYFLDSQVDSYESRKKFSSDKVIQVPLSITDEKSAIQWLYWFLSIPKSIAEIHPEFIKAQAVTKESIPELRELLEDNFVSEKDLFRRPQTTEKEQVDERREKRLLKEFNKYLQELSLNKKIQTFRKEAVVTGFTLLYREKRFDDILRLAKELPNFIIEGDIEIFDIIEVAKSKIA
jgi:cobalamin-dependent methionine synthase I